MDCAKSRRSLPAVVHKTQQCHNDLNLTHDLDLFYIRQIAHHLKEYDLEQKIDVEIRIREGTTKLLAACQHPSQSLEAAKTLRTSNERMTVYMNELQLRKRSHSRSIPSINSAISPCRGKLGLSDVRLPLMWKDTDHFKNRGDYRRFAVFCLAKVGTDVFDTSLMTPVDRSAIDITFPDNFVFTGVGHDFTLTLEVYACMLQDDLSIASTPRKLQKSLHSSISKTIGRKLSAAIKDHPQRHESGPRFDLVATATLNLESVHDDIKSHDLILENLENPQFQLPLFGHFCCRLAAQPLVEDRETAATLRSPRVRVKGNPAEPSLWSVMTGFSLEFYAKKGHKIKGKDPVLVLPINKTTKVEIDDKDTVRISTRSDEHEDIAAELVVEDSEMWTEALRQRIADFLLWHPASVQHMEIHSPAIIRQQHSDWTSRQGTLYDETPLFEEPKPVHRRPTVHEVFNLPQDNTLRSEHTSSGSISMRESRSSLQTNSTSPFHSLSRSSSTSTSSGSGSLPSWGSVRGISGMWPFSRRQNSQNDLYYIYSDQRFQDHLKKAAGNLGFDHRPSEPNVSDRDPDDEHCHPDIIIQTFSPFITSQSIMQEQFHNPYVLVVCENGIQIALKQYLDFIVIAVCHLENLHASHLLTVGCSFLKHVCGPLYSLLKYSPSHAQFASTLLATWLQLRRNDLTIATESLHYAEVGEETRSALFRTLSSCCQMLSSKAGISSSLIHVIVFHEGSLVAVYSGKGASQLQTQDILFLKILAATYLKSGSLHTQLVMLDGHAPHTVHVQNVSATVSVMVLVNNGLSRLSGSIHDCLPLLLDYSPGASKAADVARHLKTIQTCIKSTKFDLREMLVYKENANCDVTLGRKLHEIFKRICLDPSSLFQSAQHVPAVVDMIKNSPGLAFEKSLAKNRFQKVLEQYEGLVHFVLIDRRKDCHKMIAPDLPSAGHNQTSDSVWSMFHTSLEWLVEGRVQLLWNDRQLCYSHFLWIENDVGERIPWTDTLDLQNGSLGHPGVLGTDFYERLLDLNGSTNNNCYQLFCVHLGLTSPADVMEQSRDLALHLSKYFLPGTIQDLL